MFSERIYASKRQFFVVDFTYFEPALSEDKTEIY